MLSRCFFGAAVLAAMMFASALRSDQPTPEEVGAVEGAEISIKGPIRVETANGLSRTVVSSGSEITVKSGQARIDLVEGGEIGVCGPAHLSLLKASGALTVALDYGSLHLRLGQVPPLTLYTPLIVARAVDIGGQSNIVAALKATGEMCLRVTRGALRIEQQLTGQSVIFPQGREVSLADGQIEPLPNGGAGCDCEILAVKASPPPPLERKEVSVLGTAKEVRPNLPAKPPSYNGEGSNGNGNGKRSGPPEIEEPIYKVYMPPISFDASSPAPPPDPSPETILLVRTVRVRSSVVFHGHVEPARETITPKPPAVTTPTQVTSLPPATRAPQQRPSVMARMKDLFRRLWK